MVPLEFNLAKAELAVEWLPKPDKEFRRARKRWTDFVRGSKLLTPAQRQVGLTIADVFIHRSHPDHPWFNWAWPSHKTLGKKAGLCRRTVLSAIRRFSELGLLKVSSGGGIKGLGGRTDRYTLNMAGLAILEEQAEQIDRAKDVKNLHAFQNGEGAQCRGRGEIHDTKVRNLRQQDVKGLPTNLINTPKESVTETPTSSAAGVRKQLSNESKKVVDVVTSVDHTNLAWLVGKGSLGAGYELLQGMPEDEINALALRLRKEPSAADSIRFEVDARLRMPQTIRANARPLMPAPATSSVVARRGD
jgi:hypothetical protein